MKVYHGSTMVVQEPNFRVLRFDTDFGRGFYTTTDYEQAKNWSYSKKRKLIRNDENKECIHRYINVFDYTENTSLDILKYEDATLNWFMFVYQNRRSNVLIHDYDIVIGPVSEDNVIKTLNFYESGDYTIEEAIKRLRTNLLSNQISFHSEKSLTCLKYLETIEIDDRGESYD